jgi:hypothetical protein
VVGPPRTGTTWLHGVLYHRVSLPQGVRETHFFDNFYAKGLDWYQDYFRDCAGGHPVGEVATTYFASVQARERLKVHLPHCRIICIFREPVARAWSHFRMLQMQGMTSDPFEEELCSNPEIQAGEQPERDRAYDERILVRLRA